MADRDPPAPADTHGLTANLVEMHPRRIEIEIEMKIDVAIVAPRQLENACDMSMRIAVGIGAAADRSAPCSHASFKSFGTGIVEQALLRKNTNLDVDRPAVFRLQPSNGVKAVQSDARVDLDMGAHAHGAVEDRFLQRAARTPINVVLVEMALGRRDFGNRLGKRALFRFTAIENAGFIEMNMCLDEAWDDKLAAKIVLRGTGGNRRPDVDDAALGDRNIDNARLAIANAGITQDEIGC